MPYNFVADSFHKGITAEALRAIIDRKSTILIQNFRYEELPLPIIFARLVRPMNALQPCR